MLLLLLLLMMMMIVIISSQLSSLLWGRFGLLGNVVGRIGVNEVNQHRARLVLGWVTVGRRVNHLGM